MAGPRRMIQRVGKMQPTIGSIIFSEAWAAFSCARWRRLRRISSEDAGHADTHLLRLDNRLHEVVQVLDPGAAAHVVERFQAGPAQAHLLEDGGELFGERVAELVGDPLHGGVEAEAGLDRDGEQVHGVRE